MRMSSFKNFLYKQPVHTPVVSEIVRLSDDDVYASGIWMGKREQIILTVHQKFVRKEEPRWASGSQRAPRDLRRVKYDKRSSTSFSSEKTIYDDIVSVFIDLVQKTDIYNAITVNFVFENFYGFSKWIQSRRKYYETYIYDINTINQTIKGKEYQDFFMMMDDDEKLKQDVKQYFLETSSTLPNLIKTTIASISGYIRREEELKRAKYSTNTQVQEQYQSDFINYRYRPLPMNSSANLEKSIYDFYFLYYVIGVWPGTYKAIPWSIPVTEDTYDRLSNILYDGLYENTKVLYTYLDMAFKYGILYHLSPIFTWIEKDEALKYAEKYGILPQISRYYEKLKDFADDAVYGYDGKNFSIKANNDRTEKFLAYVESNNLLDDLFFKYSRIFDDYDNTQTGFYGWSRIIAPKWRMIIKKYAEFSRRKVPTPGSSVKELIDFAVLIDMTFSLQHHNGSIATHTDIGSGINLQSILNKKVVQNPARFIEKSSIPERIGHLLFGVIDQKDKTSLKFLQREMEAEKDFMVSVVHQPGSSKSDFDKFENLIKRGFDVTLNDYQLLRDSIRATNEHTMKILLDSMPDIPRDVKMDILTRASVEIFNGENSPRYKTLIDMFEYTPRKFPGVDDDDNELVLKTLSNPFLPAIALLGKYGGRLPSSFNKSRALSYLQKENMYQDDPESADNPQYFATLKKALNLTDDDLEKYGAFDPEFVYSSFG